MFVRRSRRTDRGRQFGATEEASCRTIFVSEVYGTDHCPVAGEKFDAKEGVVRMYAQCERGKSAAEARE